MKYRVCYRTKGFRWKRHKDFSDPANAELFQQYLKGKGVNSIIKRVGATVSIQYEVI